MLITLAFMLFQQGGPDPSTLDPAKEQAAIMADAKAKAGKALSYRAQYTMVESDTVKDSSLGSEGTITLKITPGDAKKKIQATWQIALDDQGQMGQEATKFVASISPKRALTLWPSTKEGEDLDLAKDKKLRYWPVLATLMGDLMKEHDVKLVRMADKYVLARTQKSSQGGETNAEEEKSAAKPSFAPATSHIFQMTLKGPVAAQCKKAALHVDMTGFFVTRVEFDWKGDGSLKSSIALKEIDLAAKVEDAVFSPDVAGYKVSKK